ncbi:DMT family transporter [Faecalicatena orotica]|uniref:EamA domain-containing membrane protein RarD n=1 Tax=Faecalicatena orotica TaxID=1544 RepID=A0A2Y9C4M5_9FIRM|nr:DMT family transporter [Faecalicatena orotica]PWJ31510.1 EamA domain-containing membrane protein RarD [Faecalicatena orotica]SSA54718.1 EamA domain-containing membrane protein RarD [Faecalicatena orotica]
MKNQKKSLISIHIAVLLFGLAGLFAKWVLLPAVIIVLGRVIFSSLSLFFLLKVKRARVRLDKGRDYILMITAGIVLAVHWTTFMQSIQTSTVAVGTLTFSTFPLFVTFLEPVLFHERLKSSSVVSAVVMLAGVLLIVPEFHLGNTMTQGVIWGMAGSLSYAVLSLMNRMFMEKYTSSLTAFYEQATAAVVLLPSLFLLKPVVSGKDILVLVLLGVVFTAFAHTMYIEGLKHVKVQTAGIISGLESVYGIIAAFLFLGEKPGIKELAGGVIILGVVFYSTRLSSREE